MRDETLKEFKSVAHKLYGVEIPDEELEHFARQALTLEHVGQGRGLIYHSDALAKYNAVIGELSIILDDDLTEEIVETTLKKALNAGKTFYDVAPTNVRDSMEEYALAEFRGELL